jgi:SAM-dependent methyltransferase
MLPSLLELLACPACAQPLREEAGALGCGGCDAGYSIIDDIPALRATADDATERVRAFYREAPFPGYPPNDNLAALRARAGRSELLQLLDAAIPGDARILDLGCGTGQIGLYLATADRLVIGADLTRASLELAAGAARRYGSTGALFVETDLRAPGLRHSAFDLVFCSGVLHHTPDPRASFQALARLAKPGGVIALGLYNSYARFPHRLRRGLSRLLGAPLFDPVLRERGAEPERQRAWLRDQYQHPLEHRHTVAEVRSWFDESGVDWLRAIPSALIGQEPPRPEDLFAPAEDDWAPESILAQLGWAFTLAHEGGLFISLGRRGHTRAHAENLVASV